MVRYSFLVWDFHPNTLPVYPGESPLKGAPLGIANSEIRVAAVIALCRVVLVVATVRGGKRVAGRGTSAVKRCAVLDELAG
jgi:hypothetical protein